MPWTGHDRHPPGGDCLCGRGPAVGTLAHTSGRMNFRAFHDGPESWHHENSADWACLDCVADTAAAIASGQVREDMRRLAVGKNSRSAEADEDERLQAEYERYAYKPGPGVRL